MNRASDFWSRRKAQVEAEERAEAKAREAAELAARDEALEDKSDAEILADLGLPDPDTLEQGADFKAFMAKAVPDRIRRRALRRLWVSNPALANLDGLLDYGEDFTDSALVVENLQTAYQVGKGMMAHVEELARQDAAREAGEDPFAMAPRDEPEDASEADEGEPEPEEQEAYAAVQDDPVAPADDTAQDASPRRRMRFAFDDHAGGAA